MQYIASIQKASRILQVLAKEPYNYSVVEISKHTGLNRTTTHRILATLKEEMFVYQSNLNKKYRLGPMMFHLGQSYVNRTNNKKDIFNIIDSVSEELNMSTGYAVLDNDKIINIYENEVFSQVRIGYNQGGFYPYHCGAYGKTIMAYQEDIFIDRILDNNELVKYTDRTITDKKKLKEEFKKIAIQGYGFSDSERVNGAIGIGAPIKDGNGEVIGSICAAGIKSLICEDKISYAIKTICRAADEISYLIP